MSDPMRPTARGVVGSHVLSPGPSPRVRGSLDSGSAGRDAHRSIPACAGEPARKAATFEEIRKGKRP